MSISHVMIEALLPAGVAWADAYADRPGDPVFPGEEDLVAQAVETRRREFVTGRRCAREALGRLGVGPSAIRSGPHREPLWPDGVVGSITHCAGYRAAAVASARDLAAIGIDAEPHGPLPDGVLDLVARPAELEDIARLQRTSAGEVWADRLLFCAKEAVFKAWFPLTGTWLGFEEAEVSLSMGRISVRILRAGPTGFVGRWMIRDHLVLAVVTLPASSERGTERDREQTYRKRRSWASPGFDGELDEHPAPVGQAACIPRLSISV